ncbi:MAG: phosphatidate cytidylyltransferase [Defluviitaleaceae bacterium]|nr:phosphatidate cytidylyltransferase [Defluviitaleaceae bacterium]
MLIRILSGIIGFAALLPLIIFGGVWLQFAVALVIIIAMWEFYRAFGAIRVVHILGMGAALAHIFLIDADIFYILPMMLVVAVMACTVLRHKTNSIMDASIAVFGFFYIAVSLSTVFVMREHMYMGVFVVWLAFIAAWGCDTGAYFSGRFFGHHKLAPKLSPNKTVEGSIGGTVAATLLGAVYGFILYGQGVLDSHVQILIFALVTFVGSIAGQIGDLAASAIKRRKDIKDFGNIMPGHGGMLDRFDSIIFTAPLTFVMLTILL